MSSGDGLSAHSGKILCPWPWAVPLWAGQDLSFSLQPCSHSPTLWSAMAFVGLRGSSFPLREKQILLLTQNKLQAAWKPKSTWHSSPANGCEQRPAISPMSLYFKGLSLCFLMFSVSSLWMRNWRAECSFSLDAFAQARSQKAAPHPLSFPPCPALFHGGGGEQEPASRLSGRSS